MGWGIAHWGLSFTYFIVPTLHILSVVEVYENAI